jgi:hypothetical protein
MPYELKEKVYALREDASVDDVCDKIKAIAGLPMTIERMIITKTEVKAEIWIEPNDGPPFGEVIAEDPSSIDSLLAKVELVEVDSDKIRVNSEALAVIAEMMMTAGSHRLASIAWVVGSAAVFCGWLGIDALPSRFLGLPIIVYKKLPEYRIVLLSGWSSSNDPLQASLAITAMMPNASEKKDASL